jgi:predicted solute-binding protein
MSKEGVKHITGVLASVFAHSGHITKEDAKEISGLDDHKFEHAYSKASDIVERIMKHEGEKMDKFSEYFSKEIDEFIKEFGGKFF